MKRLLSFSVFLLLLPVLLAGCNQASSLLTVTQSLQFSALTTGSSSMQLATVHNDGPHTIVLRSITVTGNNASLFTLNNQCGASLGAGQSCTVGVSFASTTAGTFDAQLAVSNNSPGNPRPETYLSGTASAPTPKTVYSATTIDFGSLATHDTVSKSITLANSGTAALTLGTLSISGTNASLFSQTNTCGTTLAVGASCSFTVSFAPLAAGSDAATLNIPSNDTTATQSIALTATVLAPKIIPSTTSVDFGNQATHGAASKSLTLANTGAGVLTFGTPSMTGTNANFFSESSTCGTTLAAGASCAITVSFQPLVPGTYTATLNVPSDDATAAQSYPITATATASSITIDTTTATDWKISNGVLSIDFNSTYGRIQGLTMGGSAQLVDTTNTDSKGAKGFYMDNSGFGSVTGTANYDLEPASGSTPAYLDWWITYPSSATNAYSYTMHWVVTADDPGVHVYFVANHATSDIAGSIGQVQWAFRDSKTAFTHTYAVNPSVNNPVPLDVELPSGVMSVVDQSLQKVQDATFDLTGVTVPSTWTRGFYTKYDHAGYEYLHKAHGLYGDTYGIWAVIPSEESMVAGPSKQNLYFTGNMLMMEAYSNHLDNGLTLATAAGKASSRLFGPFYIRVNKFGTAYTTTGATLTTAADLYNDAVTAGNSFSSFYDGEKTLVAAGYTPTSTRGTVSVSIGNIAGKGSTTSKAAWAVLGDNQKNFQFSSAGAQYWADITSSGTATFTNVIPGTYRLSVYEMGQWGELRVDNVQVTAGSTTTITKSFVPENFGDAVFTIGTPDRSSHEFLHGHDANGYDLKNYWGSYNYWSDFAANSGAVIYNATNGTNGSATNDLSQWNYNHWQTFDPLLWDTSNSSTDNYTNTIPSYVAALFGASGTNGVTTKLPTWKIHFATPENFANYSYVVLSVGLACDAGSYIATLNSTARTWSYNSANASDCAVRSALSGYYQWIAFQYPVSALTQTAGADNVLAIGVSQTAGAMDDALRLELTTATADHATRGWYDYEYVSTASTTNNVRADDTQTNP
jgi:hypothetical protein